MPSETAFSSLHQVFDLRQEPWVDGADFVDFFQREAGAERVCYKQHTFGVWVCQFAADFRLCRSFSD